LWLHQSGVIGASPDGLVEERNGIFEVKCPYSVRNGTIAEACNCKDFYLSVNENGIIRLRESHNYYHQIQGQLHLTNRDVCFLVVYTVKEIAIVEVQKDISWASNISKLISFYRDQLLPRLIGFNQ
jgi:hypothetical protein